MTITELIKSTIETICDSNKTMIIKDEINYSTINSNTMVANEPTFTNSFRRGYDSWGQKRNWWRKRTDREYKKKAECFVKSYSEIMIPAVGKKVNGKLTLGENIADYIGFTQALKAYRKYVEENDEENLLPNFEHYSHDKLFTMAFANLYCEMATADYVKNQLENDEHSPGRARILGVLKNSPEFAKIWRCADDAEMNPKEKCHLW